MGKSLFHEIYSSKHRTDKLGIPELVVVGEEDDKDTVDFTYHAVHRSYFEKIKIICPYCGEPDITETKIRPRKFKDTLSSEDENPKVIDLIFHQRYFRCENCNRVFREAIEFAEERCRYTNRLSDLLAEGTLTQTYEKVCKKYGVPASKTSVGIIMRRRLRMRIEQLAPLETPEVLTIFTSYYFSTAYPIVLGQYGDRIRLIDVLSEPSESAYAVFFSGLDKSKVKQVFIDPDEQLHSAVTTAFPNALVMVSEECIQRYIRDAFKEIIKKDGSRCFIHQRYHTLTKQESYLSPFEQKQVASTLKKRHRLKAAYNAYQESLHGMAAGWTVESILGWIDDLPEYLANAADEGEQLEELREFSIVKDLLQLYNPQVKAYLALPNKPPAAMSTAVMSILDSLEEMPYCIYDVLHARMLLNVEHDWILNNGVKYRIGIPVDRLTEMMRRITRQIRIQKENESNGYEWQN